MVSQPAYLRDLKAYSRAKAHEAMTPSVYVADLKAESDRGAIVLAATSIDDALEIALLKLMPGLADDDAARKRLFEADGPLSSFSSRISMAYAMGIIDRSVRDLVDLIREVRNACAHSRQPISLAVPELREAVKVTLRALNPDKFVDQSPTTYRHAFVLTCHIIRSGILNSHAGPSDGVVLDRLYSEVLSHIASLPDTLRKRSNPDDLPEGRRK